MGYKRAGGAIINGKRYWWTNWYLDELYLDQPMFKNEDYLMPDDILREMFNDIYSAYLLPMPKENFN